MFWVVCPFARVVCPGRDLKFGIPELRSRMTDCSLQDDELFVETAYKDSVLDWCGFIAVAVVPTF